MTKTPNQINERNIVLGMLLKVYDGVLSHIVLNETLAQYQLDNVQKSFITYLFKGTLEKQIELDYIIDCFSKTKTKKMKPTIVAILRMSVFQLKYMDSVPASAACNEAVKLARKHKFAGLSGFVNGVLRNIARNLDDVNYPTQYPTNLSVKYSIPEWIILMWDEQYGKGTSTTILEGLSQKDISLRVNISKASLEDIVTNLEYNNVTVSHSDIVDTMLLVKDVGSLDNLDVFRAGFVTVQNISSALVGLAANPDADDYVIDVCAAPGGKSAHMADIMLTKNSNGKGVVEARDVSQTKVDLIKDTASRCRMGNVTYKVWDGTVFDNDSEAKADIVLADVPCSGLGVIAGKSDIKYNTTKEGLDDLVKLQRKIVSNAVKYIKPGGKLIYSTCTVNKKENEENAKWIEEELKMKGIPLDYLPKEVASDQNYISIMPHDGMDGFFIAAFMKTDE